VRDILLYGVCGGVLIAVLNLMRYRFLVVEHSVEIYVALVAALVASLGIWLGLTLTRKKVIIKEIPAQPAARFVADQTRISQFGITGPRAGDPRPHRHRPKQSRDCRPPVRHRKHY
jgi:hypothetical protein